MGKWRFFLYKSINIVVNSAFAMDAEQAFKSTFNALINEECSSLLILTGIRVS